MKKSFLTSVFLVFAFFNNSVAFQLQPEIYQHWKKWESFLLTSEIVKHEDIGEGITKPKKLYLLKGDVERQAVWKNPKGIQRGFLEGWNYEIAAYQLNKFLEIKMVPPTVERKFRTRKGSLQLWVDLEFNELVRNKENIPIPEDKVEQWEKATYIARAFDSLIANVDRTQQNIRYTHDWRLILIDHSRSFRSKRTYTDQLLYGKRGLRRSRLFLKLPRLFVAKLKLLNYDRIKKIVGSYLNYDEINAVVKRKKLILKEIDEMIAANGEENVLY